MKVTVDPTSTARTRGEVFEWDEGDNVRTFTYRIL